jgi:hypothetical protein
MPAGNEVPFWSLARLGGDESQLYDQETLRGYGAGRFIDNNLFVANLEVRTRVFETDLFGTHGIAEIAPFLETGRVFHNMTQNPLSNMHPKRRGDILRDRLSVLVPVSFCEIATGVDR